MNQQVKDIAKDLQKLYSGSESAKKLFNWFDDKKKDSWEMPVRVASYRTGVPEGEIRRLFGELENLGCGRFITGRKGYETRMAWKLSVRGIAAAAKGGMTSIKKPEVEPGETLEDVESLPPEVIAATKVAHTFNLRPDFQVSIGLPADLTVKEVERLSMFLKALPAGD
jgi:hypothetical protein